MIRLFYAACAALVLSILADGALADSSNVSLSPGFSDPASSPRYRGTANANLDRAPVASVTDQQLKSERCAGLNATLDYNKANAMSLSHPDAGRDAYADNPWGGADSHSSPDRQRELERQSAMLGCASQSK